MNTNPFVPLEQEPDFFGTIHASAIVTIGDGTSNTHIAREKGDAYPLIVQGIIIRFMPGEFLHAWGDAEDIAYIEIFSHNGELIFSWNKTGCFPRRLDSLKK